MTDTNTPQNDNHTAGNEPGRKDFEAATKALFDIMPPDRAIRIMVIAAMHEAVARGVDYRRAALSATNMLTEFLFKVGL